MLKKVEVVQRDLVVAQSKNGFNGGGFKSGGGHKYLWDRNNITLILRASYDKQIFYEYFNYNMNGLSLTKLRRINRSVQIDPITLTNKRKTISSCTFLVIT